MEKHIYIFRTETNSCKIGVSKNISQRKSTIAMQGNNIIVDVFYTPKCYNAFEIENKYPDMLEKWNLVSLAPDKKKNHALTEETAT